MNRDLVSNKGKDKDLASTLGIKPSQKPNPDILRQFVSEHDTSHLPTIYCLCDASSSMCGAFGHTTKMNALCSALRDVTSQHLAGWNCKVVLFGTFSSARRGPSKHTREIRLTDPIPEPFGDTPMLAALLEAWQYFRYRPGRIVLFTDGEPTDASKPNILEAARHCTGIPIDTVAIGQRPTGYSSWQVYYDEYDPDFLQELSRITKGIFVEVADIKQLLATALQLSPAVRLALGSHT